MTKLLDNITFFFIALTITTCAVVILVPIAIYRIFEYFYHLRFLKQKEGDSWTT